MIEVYVADQIATWETCASDGCGGVCLGIGGRCWAHADAAELEKALQRLGEDGNLDARGVSITDELLERILAAAPHDADGRTKLVVAAFDRVDFGRAHFTRVIFGGASFRGATFSGPADFTEAIFSGGAWFVGASFSGDADFDGAIFSGPADFTKANFRGVSTRFGRVGFSRDAWFVDAAFSGGAWFFRAAFSGDVWFGGAIFNCGAIFSFTRFEQARYFGPVLAYQDLELDDTWFAQRVRIEVSCPMLSFSRARFSDGVQLQLRWARVRLDDADFAGPSTVTGIPRLWLDRLAAEERRIARDWPRLWAGEISERPRLLSLQRADVAELGVSGVDLSDCRFAGAHNLDKLRLDADVRWTTSPTTLKWDQRTVIAEERSWRARRSKRWTAPWWPPDHTDTPPVLEAGQIAELYRALRKSREDSKDQPGAAAFYYGEMEMRRHARYSSKGSSGRVERGILTAYWLVSGYGLTAWRAFAWLGAVIAGFALAFHQIGFADPRRVASYWASLLYAFRATVSLTDNTSLTGWGQLMQALLRLSGPVLLGLALLALRNRVKR